MSMDLDGQFFPLTPKPSAQSSRQPHPSSPGEAVEGILEGTVSSAPQNTAINLTTSAADFLS
ncbi:hypothetical protein BDW69DRAFT_163594 [Aspergillus filifer]